MTKHMMIGLLALLAALSPVGASPAGAAMPQSSAVPDKPVTLHQAQVEARIIAPPQLVTGSDGGHHLAYELHIASYYSGKTPLRLVRITVFADDAAVPLATVDGPAVAALLARPSHDAGHGDGVSIDTGRSATFFLWLTIPDGVSPASLRHRLDFTGDDGEAARADDVRTPVVAGAPVAIGPPLGAGRWIAVEGPGNHRSHHWGSLVPVDGRLTIPQRFAIDWFGLDEANHSVRGRHASLAATRDADWVGFGRDVLAVADGEVVDARDGVADGTPLAPLAGPDDLTARTLYGNFVILRIAPHIYAHYAHLRTGGVNVKIGDHVRRGAVIGRLGQTGAAGAPHLHFHLADRPTFEQSEGLAFTIDHFVLRGRGKIEDSFDPKKPAAFDLPSPRAHAGEMPLDGDVVIFR